MAAYLTDVTSISRYKSDVSELPARGTAIVEVQKHGRASVNTLLRQGE